MQEYEKYLNPEIYKSDNYLVFDFETTNLDKGSALRQDNDIVLCAWRSGPSSEIRVWEHGLLNSAYTDWEAAVRRADFLIAHNAKFELQWLKRLGFDLRKLPPVYDTMLGEYVLAGNRGWKLGLDSTAQRYGLQGKKSFISSLMSLGICPSEMPRQALIDYNIQDVAVTHEIFLRQRCLLADAGLLPVFTCRCLLVPVLADIEFNGVKLDARRVISEHERILGEFEQAQRELGQCAEGLNFRSPVQVRRHLYETLGFEELRDHKGNPRRTDGGNALTDSESIGKLKATTDEQREFRSAFIRLNDLRVYHDVIQKLWGAVDSDGGIIHARFNQSVTQTHRLSSTGGKWKIQFQNLPREFKRLFRSRNSNFIVCEADAPQLEFRCAAEVGNDPIAIKDICTGVDVHKLTQDVIGCSRTDAKPYTFKPLYGGDSGTPKERAYYKAFREKYSATYDTQTEWTYTVLKDKRLTTPSGLVFYWPDTKMDNRGYIKNKASIFNYLIQSFATADIIPLTLWLIWRKIAHLKTFIVNTIHDSIIAEVHKDEVEEYKQILVDSFTKDIYGCLQKLYNYTFKVPLGVGIKFGEYWGEGEELKYNGASDRIDSILQSYRRK